MKMPFDFAMIKVRTIEHFFKRKVFKDGNRSFMIKENTVLIVDDEKVNRLNLGKILGSTYEIVEAENGQEAIEILQTQAEHILSNISGETIKEYSVEITKVILADDGDTRDLMLTVTDKDLLETTGGIVQGMSGSPILQNGKIVGAVTHVLVNDPATGYGICLENMLKAAG